MLLLFTVLSVAMTWPAILLFGEAINSFGDTVVQMTTLAWNARALATNPLGLFEAPFFYPYQHSNAYSEHLLGQTIVALPILWATGNPAPAANFNSLLSFVLTGWGTYLLVRDLAGSRWAALAAALAFTFNGFRYMQSGHLHMLSTEWFPLTLWALRRGLNWNSTRHVALAAFFFVCMALFSIYYLFFLALVVGVYVACWVAGRVGSGREQGAGDRGQGAGGREPGAGSREADGEHASRMTHPETPVARHPSPVTRHPSPASRLPLGAKLALAGVVVGLCLLPIYYPYVQVNQELGFSRSIYEVQNWAARWQHFVNVLPSQWLWANLFPGMVSNAGERQLFPGLIISLLALVGIATGLLSRQWAVGSGQRDGSRAPEGAKPPTSASVLSTQYSVLVAHRLPDFWFYVVLGVLALVLTFGISYRLPFLERDVPLPYALLYDWVPGFTALRVPVRFAVLINLSLAVLGGYGLAWLLARAKRVDIAFVALPLLGLMLLEYVQVRDLSNHREVRPARNELAEWLASHPGPVVELPMSGGSEDVWYTYWATYHWQPLVNGFSSFVPPGTVYIAQAMQSFPDPVSIALLQGLEVRHVVVHLWQFPGARQEELRGRLDGSPQLQLVHRVGEDYIYEIAPGGWLAGVTQRLAPGEMLWMDAGTAQAHPALEALAYALRYDRLERARLPDPEGQLAGGMPLGFRTLPPLPFGRPPDLLLQPATAGESPLLNGWELVGANALAQIYSRDPALVARYDLTSGTAPGAPHGLPLADQVVVGIGASSLDFGRADRWRPAMPPTAKRSLRLLLGAYEPVRLSVQAPGGERQIDLLPGLSAHEVAGLSPGDPLRFSLPAASPPPVVLVADLLDDTDAAEAVSVTYPDTLLLSAETRDPAGGDKIATTVRIVPRSSQGRQFTLTLDVYQKPYGTHPDGHFGSWSLPLPAGEDGRSYEIAIGPADKQVSATLNGAPAEVFSWLGPPRAGDFAASLVLTEGETLIQSLPLYDFSVREGRLAEVDIRPGRTLFLPVGE